MPVAPGTWAAGERRTDPNGVVDDRVAPAGRRCATAAVGVRRSSFRRGGPLVGDAVPESTSSAAGPAVLPSADAEPSARPVGQVDPALRDTVVFERDPRLGSTVAVPSVHPAGGGGSAKSVVGTPAPQADGSADEPPAASDRGAASDTVRVGPALSGGPRARRNGHSRSREPGSGDGSAAGASEPSGPREQGRRPGETGAAPGAGRPRPTDTDGLGLGDLLAGALAAYRSI